MTWRRLLPVVLVLSGLAGCASGGGAVSPAAGAVELQVHAAASLKAPLAAVADAYEAAHPGVTLTASTDSSAALETKIEQGSPADVFLSADVANPRKLVERGFAAGDAVPFAGNELTVIVPAANPAGITTPADLGRAGVRIIACADGVPIEAYTSQWLDKVAAIAAYGADFPARVAANVVSREDNVGGIVAKVGLGEGDAGVVYGTDARGRDTVRAIAIPDAENLRATYAGVVVRASAHPDAAAAFLAWLAGPDGRGALAPFGFLPAK